MVVRLGFRLRLGWFTDPCPPGAGGARACLHRSASDGTVLDALWPAYGARVLAQRYASSQGSGELGIVAAIAVAQASSCSARPRTSCASTGSPGSSPVVWNAYSSAAIEPARDLAAASRASSLAKRVFLMPAPVGAVAPERPIVPRTPRSRLPAMPPARDRRREQRPPRPTLGARRGSCSSLRLHRANS